jgi:plastocyanin
MSLTRYLGIGAVFIGLALATAPGCSSDSNSNTGGSTGSTGGSGGSTGGSSGSTGGSSGATGGAGGSAATFMAVAPCAAESDYMDATTINAVSFLFSPKCVKVKKGASVKFAMDFTMHPLKPSAKRGDTANNPIKETTTGNEASFTFDKTGFFAFFCNFHGPGDGGTGMVGVIWVQ